MQSTPHSSAKNGTPPKLQTVSINSNVPFSWQRSPRPARFWWTPVLLSPCIRLYSQQFFQVLDDFWWLTMIVFLWCFCKSFRNRHMSYSWHADARSSRKFILEHNSQHSIFINYRDKMQATQKLWLSIVSEMRDWFQISRRLERISAISRSISINSNYDIDLKRHTKVAKTISSIVFKISASLFDSVPPCRKFMSQFFQAEVCIRG